MTSRGATTPGSVESSRKEGFVDIGAQLRKLISEGRVTDPDSPRGRLLTAAARQFRQKGYGFTTVRDLASEVGILSGSIFHHVKNKEEILFGIMLEMTISLAEAVQASVAEAGSTRDKVRALIATELSCIHGATGNAAAVLVNEWRSLSAEHQQLVLAERAAYDRQWEDTLAQAREEGLVLIEPRILHQLIHGAISWSINWFSADGDLSLEDLVDRLMFLVVAER